MKKLLTRSFWADIIDKGIHKIWQIYFKHYKIYLFIPFILLFASIAVIAMQVSTTGDFINKDITLKGGITITIHSESIIDTMDLENALKDQFAPNEVSVRLLNGAGNQVGFLIESDSSSLSEEKLQLILSIVSEKSGEKITKEDYSLEILGSSLGASFLTQTVRAMIIAFICMAVVVFIYFRNFSPSMAVIICAFSDIITTIAVVNLLGIKVGTGGIAAFLMLIGYSVDTDMLLTARLLNRKGVSAHEAIIDAFKTGMMMTLATLLALIVGLLLTNSEVIRQIMIIILVGLVIDILNTWVQNSGLLLWYLEKKSK